MHTDRYITKKQFEELECYHLANGWIMAEIGVENKTNLYSCGLNRGTIYLGNMVDMWAFFDKKEHAEYLRLFNLCKSTDFWDEQVDLSKNPELAEYLNEDGTCDFRLITPELARKFVNSLELLLTRITAISGGTISAEIAAEHALAINAISENLINEWTEGGEKRYQLSEIRNQIIALVAFFKFAIEHGYSVIPD